ncbi:MAG: dihydropteroate synthase [Bacteroidales bacterium]|nr:dihydropteroate synthase [Bacteroidales bacterium]
MSKTLQISGILVDVSEPLIMGIVNVTPDSFYDGGKQIHQEQVNALIEKHIADGAHIVDIGAFSTRPHAQFLSISEELDRIESLIENIKYNFPNIILSIDTFRTEIIEMVYKKIGGFIINDISGGVFDKNMFQIAAKYRLPYILSHLQGSFDSMHNEYKYENLITDVIFDLQVKLSQLHKIGVVDVIIDPGIGFSKNIEQNFTILKRLKDFEILEKNLLVGVSRKSLITKSLNITAQEALNATTVLHTIALQNGANILRVHDVKEAKQCIALLSLLNK